MGYLGGGLVLMLNLALFAGHNLIGISANQAVRIDLASAGIWTLIWSIFSINRIKDRQPPRKLGPNQTVISAGFKQLAKTFHQIKKYPITLRFLIAHIFYNDGIQTIVSVSVIFGPAQLHLGEETLIYIILMVQFVAYFGARFFAFLAEKINTKPTLIISLIIWVLIALYAYAVLETTLQFWFLAFCIAMVLGGTQSLSRSIFSKLIPTGQEAAFFSFYTISDRGTSWLGPALFGLINQIYGSMRLGILSLIILFFVGLILLPGIDLKRGMRDARGKK